MRERSLNGIIGYLKQGELAETQIYGLLKLTENLDFIEVIQALSEGKLKAADMITARIPLADLVEKGFMTLKNEKDKHVKILVQHE